MADQSAARPKWIPIYENRHFESQGKEHTTKWSSEIFDDGPGKTISCIFVNTNAPDPQNLCKILILRNLTVSFVQQYYTC